MKEATGELNMTVVTVVAIAAVGGFFYLFIWPSIEAGLTMNTCKNICPDGEVADVKNGWCNCADGTSINPDDWNAEDKINATGGTGYISLDNDGYIAIVE